MFEELKESLKEKAQKWKEKREEQKLLKKIYETRKEAAKIPARREAVHKLAEEHAKEEAKREVERKFAPRRYKIPPSLVSGFRTVRKYTRKMPIVQNSLGIEIPSRKSYSPLPEIRVPQILKEVFGIPTKKGKKVKQIRFVDYL
jgi:hypothetical protein